jgi:predicted small integral membrane protein
MEVCLIIKIGSLVIVVTSVAVGVVMVVGGIELHRAVDIKRIPMSAKKVIRRKVGFVISLLSQSTVIARAG